MGSNIYITGDTHGQHDIGKITKNNFPDQVLLNRNDYLIQLGDLGLLWKNDKTYQYLLDFYTSRNYTLLWIDGNHENFDMLSKYDTGTWNKGKVHFIADNIIHLMRGQVFSINGSTFFTLGGGASIDKEYRQLGTSWWKEEELNYLEASIAFGNLYNHNFKVDYVLTHSAPNSIKNKIGCNDYTSATEKFLEELLNSGLTFKKWFIGHYHIDRIVDVQFYFCYNNIIKLDDV